MSSSIIESNQFQKYIHVSKYSKFYNEDKRREDWSETAGRYMDHIFDHLKNNYNYHIPQDLMENLSQAIYHGEVMPSMRAVMTAGPALERSGIAAYNCSYQPIDDLRAFDETLYILSHGTGVGFSVEKKYTDKLPVVPSRLTDITIHRIVVEDSKEGWAESLRDLLECLWAGIIPEWDTSKVRPAGSPLKTFGGYASGPEPLEDLFRFIIKTVKCAMGRKLTSVEVADIVCYIGKAIVSGGVRRSALICLTDLFDKDMALYKSGEWWEDNPQRGIANISAVYDKKPDQETFVEEWNNIIASNSGERGIFNRAAAREQAKRTGIREWDVDWGTNPCGEILLRPRSFCNLSEIVAREDDDYYSLEKKVILATILGTFQASIDNFPYIREEWKKNVEEERLLGVSITGIFGNKLLSDMETTDLLENLKNLSRAVNRNYADKLGINESAAITCIKPSGTVSLLNGVSAGLHPWYSEYYIRSVRGNNIEPMTQFMVDAGIPNEPDVTNSNVTVFRFPMKAPEGAVVREKLSAVEHLQHWLRFRIFWCEHNPSITVQVRPEEWAELGSMVYQNFDEIGGITFLPYDSGSYRQAPFEVTDKETYEKLVEELPDINWEDLRFYEKYDSMVSSRELACSANSCEIIDVGKAS